MGTWGAGPLDSDAALDLAGSTIDDLAAVVGELLDAPSLGTPFGSAYAALELIRVLATNTAAGLPHPAEIESWTAAFLDAFDRESREYTEDDAYRTEWRSELAGVLAALLSLSVEFHGAERGTPSTRLSRTLLRIGRTAADPITSYRELAAWVAPYGDDLARAWAECKAGDCLIAIALALGTPEESLRPIVGRLLEAPLTKLPADIARTDPAALEAFAAAGKQPALAGTARAAAHLARGNLTRAVRELLASEQLLAAIAAEEHGMSRAAALGDPSGPGWTAFDAVNEVLANQVRSQLPSPPAR